MTENLKLSPPSNGSPAMLVPVLLLALMIIFVATDTADNR